MQWNATSIFLRRKEQYTYTVRLAITLSGKERKDNFKAIRKEKDVLKGMEVGKLITEIKDIFVLARTGYTTDLKIIQYLRHRTSKSVQIL